MDYDKELWLVFKDAGISLHDLMYTYRGEGGFRILEPSPWWHGLRSSSQNAQFETRLVRQLLEAVQTLHSHNVTHRSLPFCLRPEDVFPQRYQARKHSD